MSSRRKVLVALLGLGTAVGGLSVALPAPSAQAVGGVFISEIHYDNASTDTGEFVEVTAPAGTDLSAYSIVRYNGSVPSAGVVYTSPAASNALTGTAANQQDGWGTGVVNYPQDGLQNGTSDGVALVHNGTTVVEFLSYEGVMTAGASGPAAGMTSTDIGVLQNGSPIGDTLQRQANNTWTGPVANTKGAPNGYDAAPAALAATAEPDAEATVDQNMDDVVLEASGGTTPYTWATISTLPAGVSLTTAGVLDGTPTETGTFPITATVTDATNATDDVTFTLTVTEAAGPLTIAEIQGTGGATPEANETVTTSGIVTGTYPTGGFNGFYLQTAGADTTPGASDGVFVFGGGTSTFDESTLDIGDSVEVTGVAKEFGTAPNTLTEIELGASGTVTDVADLGDVVANTVIPGTDCALPGGSCLTGAALDAAKEEFEGELFQPTGDYTLTDVYDGSAANPPASGSSSNFGELGMAANSTDPLITPTEIIDAQATAAIANRVAYNNAHRVVLDDGSSTTYWNTANTAAGKDTPMPWYTPTNQVRVGAAVTFEQPVILDYRFGWKVQPTTQVTDDGSDQVSFEQDRPAQPEDVGGDIKIGTFNVLNYFTTLGVDYDAGPESCTSFKDRANVPIAVNSCTGNGPRGAWDTTSFLRQQAKIVNSINTLDADIVSVEEIENSEKVDGADRDEALSALVDALNADAGAGTWDFVDSPAEASIPANVAEQDVIRTGFIYKPAAVELIGEADMLFGSAPFSNAREPFAQAFKVAGADDAQGFAVIVNHFKSKGSGVDDGTGQGAANPDRIAQANALSAFADDFAAARGVESIFLTGDFNASSEEDPMQVLYADGYEGLQPAGEWSYSFDGTSQSLDHVLANEAASALVSGVDIWEVNANETVFNQYSRYNYNATNLYEEGPFGASDHNPEVIGIDAPAAAPTDVQILGTNDFHGRLLPDGLAAGLDCNSPGVGCPAALLAGAVKQLRGQNPNTVFAAAGDLIGASTFESFIQDDEPTIDALNEAGLDVSSVGNHEFDQGYEDLVGRVQARADWEYLAANVNEPTGRDDLAETWTQDFGNVTVGFVGAVTEELPSLVSPAGIAGVTVTDIVDATNAAALDLKADGADLVVLLVHEGSPSTDCANANFTDPNTIWGNITQNTSSDVDAIISGHTHLAYNCSFTVQDWVTDGRAVTQRPVVSSGQYGQNLNKLVFTVDGATGEVSAKTQSILALNEANFTEDPATVAIVHAAKAQADVLGAQVLGQIEAPLNRAKLANGTTENRGGESTLGNMVAEVQRWATDTPETGSAQIAFMNPGGLRTDMAGTPNGGARDVTYKQAAVVQPFANTLVNMDMTGAQIEAVLEQQWQRTADGPSGTVPTRPFLRLGASAGFTYTYVETPVTVNGTATFEGEVTGMWLNGTPIDPAASYSVTVNSFLASGGDNFRVFANGTGKADTGKVDLQAMVDYLAEFGPAGDPLAIDYSQRAVEVHNVAASYNAGEDVEFDVASWTMSTADDVKDSAIQVKLGDDVLGTATLNNTIGTAIYDQYGTAHIDVTLPANTPGGATELTLVGQQTGTEITVPITVDHDITDVQILGTNDFHGRLLPDGLAAGLDCNSPGVGCPAALLAGAVKQLRGQNPNTVFAAAGDLIGASTFESFIQDDEPTIDALNEAGLDVSSVGNHEFDQGYEDLVGRVQARADWEYLAANVNEPTGRDDLAETWTQDFGNVTVGFVGAVTEELPSLVSPAGIAGVTVTDIVDATNAAALDLKADGADLVVLLVHEGSPSTDCANANFTDPNTIWGNITQNTSSDVDAIISGHTHLAYNCSFTVQDWVTDGRAVTQRPVVSSGQYGQNLNKLVFTVDGATGEVSAKTQSILALNEANFTEDPATVAIVHAAKAQADVLGAQVLGQIEAPLNRAKLANGTTENRGGESTLGNMVAEVQRWATDTPETGSAQIAFMNPGGLRTDMAGTPNGGARDVTYKQAAVVQPFANTLVNMDMTGAQIEAVLEQQWQRTADGPSGTVPTRPFLRLGASAGFTYTYVETPVTVNGTATFEGEVTGMWLNGTPIDPAASYSVTVNSFLASGGDNFRVFANGTGKADTGKVDLQAMVDYLAEFGPAGDPLAIDYSQRAVEVHNVAASYNAGEDVEFDVASWTMSTADDVKDSAIQVKLGDDVLGTATLNNTIGTAIYDQYGTAHIDVTLPANTPGGATELTLVGQQTGTEITVPITVKARVDATVTGTDVTVAYGSAASMHVTVSTTGGPVPTGDVTLKSGGNTIGTGTLSGGEADVAIAAASLAPGTHTVTIEYAGDAEVNPATGTATVTVTKAASTVIGTPMTMEYGSSGLLVVSVGATGVVATGQVTVKKGPNLLGTGTLTNGQAAVTIPANSLPIGTHTVTITYPGDANVQAGSGTTTIKVVRPSAMVTGTDASQTYGQPTTMHVVVSGSGPVPTGSVTLKASGKTIGVANLVNGEVDVPIPAKILKVGTYPVTITYNGNATYGPSTGTATLTVTDIAPTVTGTPTTVDYGKATTMLVKVTAPGVTPTGTVTLTSGAVTIGTKTLSNGQATVPIPAKKLPVGTHTVTISYSGDANVQAGTGTTTLIVQKATPTVTGNNATQVYGKTGTMRVRVAATGVVPTGTVTLKHGTTVLGTGELGANGVVNVVLTANTLPASPTQYTVTIEYAGDDSVEAGTGTGLLRVRN